jgi:hypothetical protein
MGKVIDLPVITRLDLPPKRVLARAAKRTFQRVLVIGVLEDGSEFVAASAADGGTLLWDMERVRHKLMRIADGDG